MNYVQFLKSKIDCGNVRKLTVETTKATYNLYGCGVTYLDDALYVERPVEGLEKETAVILFSSIVSFTVTEK